MGGWRESAGEALRCAKYLLGKQKPMKSRFLRSAAMGHVGAYKSDLIRKSQGGLAATVSTGK